MSIAASQNRLKLSTFKLNALLGMAQAISAELKTEEILDRFRVILNDDLGIDRILLFKKLHGSYFLTVIALRTPLNRLLLNAIYFHFRR